MVPKSQPFATVVTKDYPDDEGSQLSRPGAFRLNVSATPEEFSTWTGREPREPATDDVDPSTEDVVIAHPVYGSLAWLAVVNPGPRSDEAARDLLRSAHRRARERYRRRHEETSEHGGT